MARRKKSEYRRALEFAGMLALLGGLAAVVSLLRHHGTRAAVFAGVGFGALVLALVARSAWLAFFRIWMKFAEGLGWVSTRIILSLFYYLVMTPVGWSRRLIGKPTLDTVWRDGKSSYWIEREPVERSIERYAKRY